LVFYLAARLLIKTVFFSPSVSSIYIFSCLLGHLSFHSRLVAFLLFFPGVIGQSIIVSWITQKNEKILMTFSADEELLM